MPSDPRQHGKFLALIWCMVAWQFFGAALLFKKINASSTSAILGFLIGALFYQSLRTPTYAPLIIPGCVLALCGLVLFQWAALTIRGHFFSYILSDDEPQFVLNKGPFAYIRHPFYTSYLLTQGGGALVFPSWITFALLTAMAAFFFWATNFEEAKFANSARSADYLAYRQRTGRFFPKLGR